MAEFMQESIVFLVRVQCRRKEGSRSLSHLLTSFLLTNLTKCRCIYVNIIWQFCVPKLIFGHTWELIGNVIGVFFNTLYVI